MRKLIIERSTNSPGVTLDPEINIFEISGESRPPDVSEFYGRVFAWFEEYSVFVQKPENHDAAPVFTFDLDFFNSSSAKCLLDICKMISVIHNKGIGVSVNWLYEEDDYDMLESGKELSRISKMPFVYTGKEVKK